ncbi:MAG: hypothetical protein LC687_04815 [Actinobacteria bacterium]|nr:hypothetical protein [Actinomycetota bacterium]MCA1807155.1 hypothetical protein [Actinomycetota bacterium]
MDNILELQSPDFGPLYSTVCVDVFGVAHFMYHSGVKAKKDEGTGERLEQVELPNKRRDGQIYPRMALMMIEFFEKLERSGKQVHLLFDNATSKETARQYISETYKSSRNSKPPVFYRTVDFVQFYCTRTMGDSVRITRVPKREADDLVKGLLLFNEVAEEKGLDLIALPEMGEHEKVLCIANDSDWYACLGPKVHQVWFGDKEPYTADSFVNEFGFEPTMKRVAVYKALMGDKGDDIEAVLRKKDIPHDDLIYLVTEYSKGTLAEALPVVVAEDPKIPQKVKNILRERRDKYQINLKLTDYLPTSLARMEKYTSKGKQNHLMKKTLIRALTGVVDDSSPMKKFNFGGVAANV